MKKLLTVLSLTTIIINAKTVNESMLQLARAWQIENNSQQAIAAALSLLERDPNNSESLLLLGMEYYKQGNSTQALSYFEHRLQLHPNCATTHLYLGMTHAVLNNLDNALYHYQKAQLINPELTKVYGVMGIALEKKGLMQDAIEAYEQGIAKDPQNHELRLRLADVLKKQTLFERSLHHYEIVLEKNPNHLPSLQAKAELLVALGDMQGFALFDTLLESNPHNKKLLLANAQLNTRNERYDRACERYEQFLTSTPSAQHTIHFELSKLYLLMGNTEKGFYHLHMSNTNSDKNHKLLTRLEDIPGSTILVRAEWLHEDMLHFMRFARTLKELGAFVVVQTPKNLKPLLSLCPYIDRVLSLEQKEHCPFDFYIPITSLPYVLQQLDAYTINCSPYLFADQKLVAYWKNKIHRPKTKNIGLYLKSASLPAEKIVKQIPADYTMYLLYSADGYNSLQQVPENYMIHCFGRGFDESGVNLMHLAAIIENLDVVITTDCTIAHLAGGLGKKTMVLCDTNPIAHWRLMTQELCKEWYPAMACFTNLQELKTVFLN